MSGRNWSKDTIEKMLLPIIKEKVLTEKELMKMNHMTPSRLNSAYKSLVNAGFPIRRRTLESMGASKKAVKRNVDHRIVIYYME